jgi:hypothetical protein
VNVQVCAPEDLKRESIRGYVEAMQVPNRVFRGAR